MLRVFWDITGMALAARLRGDEQALQFARSLVWDCDSRMRHWRQAGPLRLPTVDIHDLVGERELSIHTDNLRTTDGGISPFETLCIAAIAQQMRPRCVFEIGTFQGQTTRLLAQHSPPDARIWTLDLEPAGLDDLLAAPAEGDLKYIQKPQIGQRAHSGAGAGKVRQLLGDSMVFDFSSHYGQCDVVFVDGAHSYAFVKSDSRNAFRLLRPGGAVLWHDYKPGCPGVVRALHEVGAERELRHITGTSLVICGLPTPVNQRPAADAGATQQKPVSV